MRGAQKRGLEAGASNAKHDRHMVELTLQCAAGDDTAELEEMVDFLRSGRQLNSWGARVEQLEELPHGRPISECDLLLHHTLLFLTLASCVCVCRRHEVHTGNVDNFQWNSNVEMYL